METKSVVLKLVGLWECPKCKCWNAETLAPAEFSKEETEAYAVQTGDDASDFVTGAGYMAVAEMVSCEKCGTIFDVEEMVA